MSEQNEQLRYTSDGALAECPCCGSLDVGGAHDTVHCYGCGLTVSKPRPLQNAIDAWNRRAQPAPTVQAEPTTNAVLSLNLVAATGYEADHRYGNITPEQWGDVVRVCEGTLKSAAPAHASSDGRDAILEEALSNLIDVAERCDSWESFPENELDKARAARAGTGVKGGGS